MKRFYALVAAGCDPDAASPAEQRRTLVASYTSRDAIDRNAPTVA
jgi:hypothetical protein